MLARRWAERERLTLRLPPHLLNLEPGSLVALARDPGRKWRVARCTLDRFVVIAELAPHRGPVLVQDLTLTAESSVTAMRMVNADDAVARDDLSLALFEVPALDGQLQTQPVLLLAASSSESKWRSQAARLEVGAMPCGSRPRGGRVSLAN